MDDDDKTTEPTGTVATYDKQIRELGEAENKHREAMKSILDGAKDEAGVTRSLDEDEKTRFDAEDVTLTQFEERRAQLTKLRDREVAAIEQNKRYGLTSKAVVTNEHSDYTRISSVNGGPSYFRDLYFAKHKHDETALARLRRNDKHVAAYQERAGLTTVNGAGGELVPPLWLEEDWIPFVRAGRKTANLCVQDVLPGGTDSINIPKVSSGSAVAYQGTQNTLVNETDLATTSISAGVYTVAGGQTISVQLVEQSPINVDKIVMQDLGADHARFIDASVVLNGSGTGQPSGILVVAGTTTVTYTSASPTTTLLYSKIAGAIQGIEATRFMPPTHIVMHPRRWAYFLAAVDTAGRPLVVPNGASFNQTATSDGVIAEGVVGTLQGLPVVVDANIPTNAGAGTNEDKVIIAKFDDLFLWEGRLNADIFPQTFAQNASLYARLYNYVAFQPARYLQSIAIVTGTGLVAPAF